MLIVITGHTSQFFWHSRWGVEGEIGRNAQTCSILLRMEISLLQLSYEVSQVEGGPELRDSESCGNPTRSFKRHQSHGRGIGAHL